MTRIIVLGFFTAFMIMFKYAVFVGIGGSVVTSSVKSISKDCGTTYDVESLPLVTGNLFCKKSAK